MTALSDSVTPAPPAEPFGSYDPAEVTWLLTDLSEVSLEVPDEDREELIQGGRPYFEMLPVEFQPDPQYLELFTRTLHASAARLAADVACVSDLVLEAAPVDGPVLVSLARAGTPIGILMRRWLATRHDLRVPHYTMSIVRGGGIDTVALDYLLAQHRPEQIRFVDGWTCKGAIAKELTAAVNDYMADHAGAAAIDSELAVLADTGSCTSIYGTRDDFLIPSACLNSTVSGLVSRTVFRDDLIGPGMFHGAKFYAELAPHDVSALFLDIVSAKFDEVSGDHDDALRRLRDSDRRPTWVGWKAIASVAAEFGIPNLNLVKPGVGETTRVLLRRIPWQILVRPDRVDELEHVLLLARARNVPVVERPDLPYSCIGLIRPSGMGTP